MIKSPKLKWFLPLLLLLLLKAFMMSIFISGIIGGNVAEATGIAAERISVNGRNVTIDGFTSEAEGEAAARVVKDDVAWVADVNPIVSASSAAPSAVTLTADAGRVVVGGVVASEATRSEIIEAAEAEFAPDREVVDELTVDGDAVSADSGEVIINGTADDEEQKADWIAAATAVATANGFDISDDVDVAEVEAEPEAEEPAEEEVVDEDPVGDLNALFELAPIEFDTSQATIRPESQATLDEAAATIIDNPDAGRFRVVGHTDSVGDETLNQELSEARAQAVVDYLVETGGVDAARLEAEGRGESEPKVAEESAADRQENRRIEWELV